MPRPRRYRIEVESYTEARDSQSEMVKTWSLFKTLYASKAVAKGTEGMTGDRPDAVRPITFEVRYRDDLTEDMRIKWNGKYFEIIAIQDRYGLKKYTTISCMERPESGWNVA